MDMIGRALPSQRDSFVPEPEDDIVSLLFGCFGGDERECRHRGIICAPTAGNNKRRHRNLFLCAVRRSHVASDERSSYVNVYFGPLNVAFR